MGKAKCGRKAGPKAPMGFLGKTEVPRIWEVILVPLKRKSNEIRPENCALWWSWILKALPWKFPFWEMEPPHME